MLLQPSRDAEIIDTLIKAAAAISVSIIYQYEENLQQNTTNGYNNCRSTQDPMGPGSGGELDGINPSSRVPELLHRYCDEYAIFLKLVKSASSIFAEKVSQF